MNKIAIMGAGSAGFARQMITDGPGAGQFAWTDVDPVQPAQAHAPAELTVACSSKPFTASSSTNHFSSCLSLKVSA